MHDVSGRAVQFINPTNNRLFEVDLDQLKSILEVDGIKDRNVVVVSVAGAVQCGKRFLLNFFIRYLHAQVSSEYKRHNLTEWMENNVTQGFHCESGLERNTVGFWMWSEIFTHDYENGDRVAIILLDTEGIFDDSTSCKASSSIFTLTMMLSSVQCFNVMHNIQADHLQHFRSVTEYGTLASKRLAGKPFQKLIFLVRDSSNALGYGYHDGSRLVDEMVATNGDQTADMFEMIRRIAERFDKIGVFLMPQPGMTVTQGHEFSGAVPDPEFQDCVKELSHHLFAPENLIFKQINGERVRAGDLVQYIQAYVRVFNSNNLPDMDALLKATLEVIDSMLINECVKFYRLAI